MARTLSGPAWAAVLLVAALGAVSCANDEGLAVDPGAAALGVGTIQGTVTVGGAPFEGALVTTVPFTASATTDALGRYTLAGLASQTVTLNVAAAGYVTGYRSVAVVAGRTAVADFSLLSGTAAAGLSGTITDGEVPLERVAVSTVPATLALLTSGDGRYDIANVTPGSYRVDAFRVGFWPGRLWLTALPGQVVVGDLCLGRRADGVIDGTVRDEAGTPVAGAQVDLFFRSSRRTAFTGADGRFRFTDLMTDYYVVSVTASGYYPASRSLEAWGGVVRSGDVILTLTGTAAPLPGAVAGTVWDAAYVPISAATVTLDPAGPTTRTTTTGVDGRFFFTRVLTGPHTVSAGATDYESGTASVVVGTTVTADGSLTLKRAL